MSRPAPDFDHASTKHAHRILREYSTSFWLATRALPSPTRDHIAALYALVRMADEIVDDPSSTRTAAEKCTALNELECSVNAAVAGAPTTDPVVHAFARTTQACQLTAELWAPFFDSMRQDLTVTTHSAESLAAYIYGSAEVVGLMCVNIFFSGPPQPAELVEHIRHGARCLGDAFQRINFLRDIAYDHQMLGRTYLANPHTALTKQTAVLTEDLKTVEIARIEHLLAQAAPAIELLPREVRPAVRAATLIFARLADKIAATPAHELERVRVRISSPEKARLVFRACTGGPLKLKDPLPPPAGRNLQQDAPAINPSEKGHS